MTKYTSAADAAARITKLRELINDYRYHYHVLDESIMSEAAADSLKHELTELETQFPELITPDSPTQRVAGAPLPGFTQVEHSARMLSLNDVFDASELRAWQTRVAKLAPNDALSYFVDIKMDGFACALVYEDGVLVRGITRGDGFVGEDVTANVRTIDSIPLTLRKAKGFEHLLQGRTEIRGEIVMYKAEFDALNAERAKAGKPLFANPRNTAAGTIRQLDPKLVAARPLHFRGYDLRREDDVKALPTHEQSYQALRALGFLANEQATVFNTIDAVMKFADEWDQKRHDLPFNTDGLVIKINDRTLYDRLGVVGKAPRGAVALKYAAEQATTKVKDIFISIGRTGSATPVAMLEPVVVAGSTVQMATLHNESEVKRKDIRVGDTVIVHKAGDIIPEIVEALVTLRDGSEQPFVMPTKCPECSTDLVKLNAKDAAWRCPNESCPTRAWRRIEHFASKGALDIEGLGEKNVIALLNGGLIQDVADIYNLTAEQVVALDRFATLSANKLVQAIQAKKTPPLARFIYGLGIRHIGTQTANDLARHFRTLDALQVATIDDLAALEGIGEIVAESVVEYFSEQSTAQLFEKFKNAGVWPQAVQHVGGPLEDMRFVVTGTLESLSREQAAERIRELGGTFQSSVAKDTTYLVAGGKVGASKLAKAQKFGTQIIDEAALLKLLGDK